MTASAARTALHAPFGAADIGVVIGMNLAWGLNIVAMKYTVEATAPLAAAVVRLIAVALLCLPKLRPPPGRGRVLLLFGLVNGGGFLLFSNLALKAADNVGALAIAGQLSTPIAIILGVVFLGERMTWRRLAGVALAFAGVVLLVFDPRVIHELPSVLLMTCAAALWAVSALMQRRLGGVHPFTLYGWTGVIGASVLLPLSLLFEPGVLARVPSLPAAPIGWFAFTVLGATMAGQSGMAWLLGRHPIGTVMPLTLIATVVSVVAAHLLLGGPLTAWMAVGGLVTLAGVLIVTLAAARPIPPSIE